MFTSANSHTKVSILCACEKDLRNIHVVNAGYTFETKGQMQVLAKGEMSLHVNVQGKGAPIKATPKHVLRIPGMPCRLLTTGMIRGKEGDSWTPVRSRDTLG